MTTFEECLDKHAPLVEWAVTRLYPRYLPPAYPGGRADLLAVGTAALWRAWQAYDPARGKFTTLAVTAITRACVTETKRVSFQGTPPSPYRRDKAWQEDPAPDGADDMLASLRDERAAFILRETVLCGKTLEEVGLSLGMSRRTVLNRKRAALARLRKSCASARP